MRLFVLTILTLSFCVLNETLGQKKRQYKLPAHIAEQDYARDIVIVKLKGGSFKNVDHKGIAGLTKIVKGKKYKPAFQNNNKARKKLINPENDLSNIFKIYVDKKRDIVECINQLLAYDEVIYAEPYFNYQLLYVPNDPEAAFGSGAQDYLEIIKAYDAWEYEKGNSEITIGILDSGVQLDHPDLKDNIKFNYNDPVNGIDDDLDGYIDNFSGWDFGNDDSDPTADLSGHGTAVSGVSSASTDNGIGIAGVGFKSTFLPLKIFTSEGNTFNNGYEAILYAADQGCKVINLSWGAPGSFSHYAQDIINFVTIEKDVVIVAAAGNTNLELDFYPASYTNVLSVGATNSLDQKASFATYSKYIDIMAPGNSEFTTLNGNSYGSVGGSSFSAPMAAGVAALVRSRYPHLNARQVIQKIRLAADNLYNVPENAPYFEMLGKGRLNAAKAIAPANHPAIRMTSFSYGAKAGPFAFGGDTVMIRANFQNILNETSNAKATLTSTSPYVTIIHSETPLGKLLEMEEKDNFNDPFIIYLDPSIPANEKLVFRLGYNDLGYDDYQYFEFTAESDYLMVDTKKVVLTVGSNGDLGYVDDLQTIGTGFAYKNETLVDNIGLAIGYSSGKITDNIINNIDLNTHNSDFEQLEKIRFYSNSEAQIDARSTFDDSNAGSNIIGLRVEQKFLGSTGDTENNFLIVEYRITNTSGGDISDLYTGLYADWNLSGSYFDKADWDPVDVLGYVYDGADNDLFAGIALISDEDPVYNAIDLSDQNGNVRDIGPSFTKTQKFDMLSTSSDTKAGELGGGNDVAHTLSARVPLIKNNESVKIAFMIATSENYSGLKAAIPIAKSIYNAYLDNPPVTEVFRICKDESATLDPFSGTNYRFFDDPDTTTFLFEGASYTTGSINETRSYYAVNTDESYYGDIEQMIVKVIEPRADFLYNPHTVFIDENNETSVQFTDVSDQAILWDWDFGNGFTATSQNPSVNFDIPGDYTVKLNITSEAACVDSKEYVVSVVTRGPRPMTSDQEICPNESVTIEASNATNIRVYSEETLENLIYEGTSFHTGTIVSDSNFYVTNVDATYESLAAQVTINVNELSAAFDYHIDTLNLEQGNVLKIYETGENSSNRSWYRNDEFLTDSQTDFDIILTQEEEIKLKLLVQNTFACVDSVETIIEVKKSPMPQNELHRFCYGEKVIIRPQDGNIFYFYENEQLGQPFYKGSTLDLSTLFESTKIYYTNADLLLQSDPAEIDIDMIRSYTNFSISTDTLFTSENTSVEFTDLSDQVVNRMWYFEDGQTSEEVSLSKDFNFSGIYKIKLTTENDIGCVDSLERKLVVLTITAAKNEPDVKNIKIYPNPSYGYLTIELNNEMVHPIGFSIIDKFGKIVYQDNFSDNNPIQVKDLTFLSKGVYFIRINPFERYSEVYKVVIH